EARRRYISERPLFELAASAAAQRFKIAAARAGLECAVTHRAKDVGSFVKKAFTKKLRDPWLDIPDKAGVRITVGHPHDLDVAKRLAITLFGDPLWVDDDRETEIDVDRLAYPRLHVHVRVSELDAENAVGFGGLPCEIQIRTEAEDLWAR